MFLTVEFQVGEECESETLIDRSKCKTDTQDKLRVKDAPVTLQHTDAGTLREWESRGEGTERDKR